MEVFQKSQLKKNFYLVSLITTYSCIYYYLSFLTLEKIDTLDTEEGNNMLKGIKSERFHIVQLHY